MDYWLLDNVFQRFGDFLARELGYPVTRLARQLLSLGGVTIIPVVFNIDAYWPRVFCLGMYPFFLACIYMWWRASERYEQRCERGETIANPGRYALQSTRWMYLFWVGFMVATDVPLYLVDGATLFRVMSDLNLLVMVAAVYFLSCNYLAPPPKRVTQFAHEMG